MWYNPIPAETVIGAIVGAVLSTILAQNEYFKIQNWMDTRYGLMFTVLIISFGVCAHFYCAARNLSRHRLANYFLLMCFLVVGVVLLINAQKLNLGLSGTFTFLPRWTNVMMAGVMMIWLCTLRILNSANGFFGGASDANR